METEQSVKVSKLCIQTFGNFDILVDGKSLFTNQIRNQRHVNLLIFLIGHHHHTVTAEFIIDEMWPNLETNDLRNYLRVYIHRLRKMLKGENSLGVDISHLIRVCNHNGIYGLTIDSSVSCDYAELEQICETIHSISPLTALNRILHLYKGNYLSPVAEQSWVYMLQNYYQRLFSKTCRTLLAQLEQKCDWNTILQYCEEILKIHDIDEEINILFLNALLQTKQPAAALQFFSFITSKLFELYNIPQSSQMKSMYKQIRFALGESENNNESRMNTVSSAVSAKNNLLFANQNVAAAVIKHNETPACYNLTTVFEKTLRKEDLLCNLAPATYLIIFTTGKILYQQEIIRRIKTESSKQYPSLALDIHFLKLTSIQQLEKNAG